MTWLQGPMWTVLARTLAGVFVVASMVAIWFGLGIAAINIGAAAQQPNPSIADGDPCCWHPDDWAEVAGGIAFGLATLIAVAALFLADLLLARYAAIGRSPSRRQWRRVAACVAAIAVWAVVATAL